MKKAVLFIMLVSSAFSIYAIDELTSDVRIWGYYESQTGAALTIVDYNNTQLYETITQASTAEHYNKTDPQPIFSWYLSGVFGNSCTVKFTFNSLQAYVNGQYYRPAYSMVAEKPTSTASNDFTNNKYSFTGTNLTTTSTNAGGTKTFSSVGQSEQSFSDTFAYSFKFTRAQSRQVTRQGVFKLHISSYNSTAPGTFNYQCNVSVEFTTN